MASSSESSAPAQSSSSFLSSNSDVMEFWNRPCNPAAINERGSDLSKVTNISRILKSGDLVADLQKWKFLPTVKKCTKCGNPMTVSPRNDRAEGEDWRCRVCVGRLAIRSDTMFAAGKIPLESMAAFLLLYTEPSISYDFIRQHCQMDFKTIGTYFGRVNDVLAECLLAAPKIGGRNVAVEFDETNLGDRRLCAEGKEAFRLNPNVSATDPYFLSENLVGDKWVIGAVERLPDPDKPGSYGRAGAFRMAYLGEQRDVEKCKLFLLQNVHTESIICTDSAERGQEDFVRRPYNYDYVKEAGYQNHQEWDHSARSNPPGAGGGRFVDPVSGNGTILIDSLWMHLKKCIVGSRRHGANLNGHVARFVFLLGCYRNDIDPFKRLLQILGRKYASPTDEFNEDDSVDKKHESDDSDAASDGTADDAPCTSAKRGTSRKRLRRTASKTLGQEGVDGTPARALNPFAGQPASTSAELFTAIGFNDVVLDYNEPGYKLIRHYKPFGAKVRPLLIAANPGRAIKFIQRVSAMKWTEFQAYRRRAGDQDPRNPQATSCPSSPAGAAHSGIATASYGHTVPSGQGPQDEQPAEDPDSDKEFLAQ